MANNTDLAKKSYSIRIDPDMLEWLEQEAKRQKRKLANLIDVIFIEYKERKAIETTIPIKKTKRK